MPQLRTKVDKINFNRILLNAVKETMVVSEGKFLRQREGKGYAARVFIELNEGDSYPRVTAQLETPSIPVLFSQGDIEKAYAPTYNDWIQGAVIGASYALAKLKNSVYMVTITTIIGMETDTNPTIVAAAAIFAVWNAVNYHPHDEIQFIIDKVFASWDLPPDTMPTF